MGEGRIEKQVRGRFSTESLDVGLDALTPVSRAYADRSPFAFTGRIVKAQLDLADGAKLTVAEELEIKVRMG